MNGKRIVSLALAAGVCVTLGCDSNKKKPGASSAPDAGQAEQVVGAKLESNAHLDALGGKVIEEIVALETKKDVTCWTSFRQLDNFIAAKQYSDYATLTKIALIKQMIRAIWAEATQRSGGAELGPEQLEALVQIDDAALSEGLDTEGLSELADEIGMRDYKDYRKTSEHWRILLSVIQDDIVTNRAELAPLNDEALDKLADLTTRLSLSLLRESGQVATTMHSPYIEAEHVRRAHEVVAKRHGVDKLIGDAAPKGGVEEVLDQQELAKRLHPLTSKLIDGKVEALVRFNKEADLLSALNKVSRLEIDPQALPVLMAYLKSFTFFVSRGFEPMRSDNFLSDGSFAKSRIPRRRYLDPVWTENVIMQIFPHVMMPNGDIKLRFEPNPGTITDGGVEAFDLLMLDYEQNGVRDSAIHWLVMEQVFEDKPFAMDPFAAEYLSEVASMMMTFFIRRAEQIAKEQGESKITAAIAKRVRDPRYVQVMPRESSEREWTEEQEAAKKKALAGYPAQLFEDVTAASGLPAEVERIEGNLTEAGLRADIQRVMGSGVAVGDVDRDGYPDLFIAGEGLGRLYLNRGEEAPGQFVDATARYKLPEKMYDSRGVLFFDREGDGDLDLLVIRSGNPSRLFELDGEVYRDVTEQVGLKTHNGAHVATVFDHDGDGDLDIFIGYYGSDAVNRGGSRERNLPAIDGRNSTPAQLWRREADGSYREVAAEAGVADTGWTLAASAFDYDRDGDADLYLANDFGANSFYRNDGGRFTDASQQTRTADRGSGMNVSFADVDADGWLDFYVTNIDMFSKSIKIVFPNDASIIPLGQDVLRSFKYITGNKLYMSREGEGGARHFESEEMVRFEPGDRGWAWDGNFFDYELDGDEDIYIANGWIEGSHASDQKNQMFIRDGEMFYLSSPESPEAFAANSRAVASVDVDRDGDLDLVVTNFRGAPRLLKNVQAAGNRAARIKLVGAGANTRAVGARLEVEVGGQAQVRQVTCGRGYLSQDDPDMIIVGLGSAEAAKARVFWPGQREASQEIEITAGEVAVIEQKK